MSESNGHGELSFTLRYKERPVRMELEDNTVESYTLIEIAGDERDAYINMISKRQITLPDGTASISDARDIQAQLVHYSLHDQNRERIPLEKVRKFPASTLTALWEAARDLSGLEDEALEEAKND